MDEEMEEGTAMEVYEVVEVDFEYEFDAARFFDFTRPETESEARRSESWFDFATSYPPSPFVAKLFPTEDLYTENVFASLKSKYDNGLSLVDGDNDIAQATDCCDQDEGYRDEEERNQIVLQNVRSDNLPCAHNQTEDSSRGFLFYSHLAADMKKTKAKPFAKSSVPRSSTLMKPTASQLAKQNQRRQVNSRFQKNEGSSNAHLGIESQASKRQKLDGGFSRKIVDVKQLINLIHKVPKKDCAVQGMISQTKLRITIPREPELETAHRAERTRSTSTKKVENETVITSRFKARPLNKKILEAPVLPISKKTTSQLPEFHAFHLKTTERAKHHASAAVMTSLGQTDKALDKTSHNRVLETGNKDEKRCDSVDAQKIACQPMHSFKARPLDRKILTSRGDIGVFRNSKRDVTVPKEFQFQTAKRNQQNPPIDLFSKLSLAGEPQPKSCAQLGLSQKPSISSKPSKENRCEEPCRQNQYMKHQEKEKSSISSGKQTQSVANGVLGEVTPRVSMRPFGIWRQQ